MADRPAEIRVRDFREVDCGLSPGEAIAEAERCLQCKKPLCVKGCPVCIDIPTFVRQIAEGDFPGAARTLKEQNMLPAICGRVCPRRRNVRGPASSARRRPRSGSARLSDSWLTGSDRTVLNSLRLRRRPGNALQSWDPARQG